MIDIHTHKLNLDKDSVVVLDPRNIPEKKPELSCLGVHPWYLEEIKDVKEFLNTNYDGNIYALGEIGLDKVCKVPFSRQIEAFNLQLEFAKSQNIQRIIIHCVKAYDDVFKIIKQSDYDQKILFHDFHSSKEMAFQLLNHFDAYFSFGNKIPKKNKKSLEVLKFIPKEKIFFETDDQYEFSINDIYHAAANVLMLQPGALEKQISMNFQRFSA